MLRLGQKVEEVAVQKYVSTHGLDRFLELENLHVVGLNRDRVNLLLVCADYGLSGEEEQGLLSDTTDFKLTEVNRVEARDGAVVIFVNSERTFINQTNEISLSRSSRHIKCQVLRSHGKLEVCDLQVVANLIQLLLVANGLADNINRLAGVLVLESVNHCVLVHEHRRGGLVVLAFPVAHQVDVLGNQRAKCAVDTDNQHLVGVDLEAILVFSRRLELR